jgi:hypothetical protein
MASTRLETNLLFSMKMDTSICQKNTKHAGDRAKVSLGQDAHDLAREASLLVSKNGWEVLVTFRWSRLTHC